MFSGWYEEIQATFSEGSKYVGNLRGHSARVQRRRKKNGGSRAHARRCWEATEGVLHRKAGSWRARRLSCGEAAQEEVLPPLLLLPCWLGVQQQEAVCCAGWASDERSKRQPLGCVQQQNVTLGASVLVLIVTLSMLASVCALIPAGSCVLLGFRVR